MVTALAQTNPVQAPARSNSTASNRNPDFTSKGSRVDLKSDPTRDLHSQVETLPKTYEFKEIKAEDSRDALLSKILNRFGINTEASKYDKAVISDDGNTLVIVNQGTISLNQLFGGTNGFVRCVYKVYGPLMKALGAADRDIAARRYYKLFNAPGIEEHGEPLKYLIQALKKGEYHTVTVFHRDPQTNKFSSNPTAVAITDAYYHLIDDYVADSMQGESQADIDAAIKTKKEKFAKYFTLDKVIPLADSSPQKFEEIMHQIVEGLYQAQGFDYLVVPSQIHTSTDVNSNDLNYRSVDWHFLRQNGVWKIVGNPELLDKIITDPAKRETYIAKMNLTEKSREDLIKYSPKITIVRPKDSASQAIDPEISELQQRSTVSQGSQIRIDNQEDLKLIGMTVPVNKYFLQAAQL